MVRTSKRFGIGAILLAPLVTLGWASVVEARPCTTGVVVNGDCVPARTVRQLEARFGQPVPKGAFWYDVRSGLYGRINDSAAGVLPPNLPFRGVLRADASGGTTGVFVNGRQLTVREVNYLRRLGPVRRGRYWMDAASNVGFEGTLVPFVNLVALARQQRSQRRGAYSWTSKHFSGMHAGSDGRCSYVSTPSGSVMTGDCN